MVTVPIHQKIKIKNGEGALSHEQSIIKKKLRRTFIKKI